MFAIADDGCGAEEADADDVAVLVRFDTRREEDEEAAVLLEEGVDLRFLVDDDLDDFATLCVKLELSTRPILLLMEWAVVDVPEADDAVVVEDE